MRATELTQEARVIEQMQEHDADRPRVLVVENDAAIAMQVIRSLRRECAASCTGLASGESFVARSCNCQPEPCWSVIGLLRQLHETDLESCDVVICGASLPDGSGLDALAYLRGVRPELAVILAGEPGDAAIAVEAIRAGALDFSPSTAADLRTLPLTVEKCLAHQRIKLENERLQRDLGRSLADLEVKNVQLRAAIHQLDAMARTDDLTGLSNRRSLNDALERTWAEAARSDQPLAFIMIDLDGFKVINDQLGHQYGDQYLRQSARVIEANCRQVDIAARYGGDEFCLLMPHTTATEAVAVAHRILEQHELIDRARPSDQPSVGLSIGVAQIDVSRPTNADQLVRHADEAMYAAKQGGKHQIMLRELDGIFPTTTPNERSWPQSA